jgi:hypothetical protein
MSTPLEEEFDPQSLPFGLLELDADGTVLYYKPDAGEGDGVSNSRLIGRNLFTEVPTISRAGGFRDRLNTFRRSHAPADSFLHTFQLEHGDVQAKILLARLHERSAMGSTESILLHIMKPGLSTL